MKNTEHGNYAYGYDVQDRLISAAYPASSESFSYDKVGNRVKHNNSSPWTYNANNELTARPAVTYQYDANGSQIKKTENGITTDYIYDGSNRLVQVKQGASMIASYAYDPFGRRISKTVNGNTTYYFYSDEGLTAEADSTGAVKVSYGYAPNSIWGTDPLYMRVNNTYHYYLNDHLGTPQQLAQKNGAKTWAAIYEAFGKATVTTSTVTNNLRFPGQYADSETGLHYNWNRAYDNQTGRYTKADPIGLRGGLNEFSYTQSNPVLRGDTRGLFYAQLIGLGIGLAFEGYDQWQAGKLDLGRLAVAGLTGALGGFAKGVISGAFIGGFGGGFNNFYKQISEGKGLCFDQISKSAVRGVIGGAVGAGFQKVGSKLYKSGGYTDVNNVLHPELNTYHPTGNYGNFGAAAGGALGTGLGNLYGNQ